MIYIKLNYWRMNQMTDEAYATARQHLPLLPEDKSRVSYEQERHLVDWPKLTALAGVLPPDTYSLEPFEHQMLVKLQDRIAALELREASHLEQIQAGARVSIHVPDLPLMKINEVKVLDDACTDELQEHLNERWRILAVCPPNAKRRPDYILGRRRDD